MCSKWSSFMPLGYDLEWWQEFLRGWLCWDSCSGNHQRALHPCFPRLWTSESLWIEAFCCCFFSQQTHWNKWKQLACEEMATDGRRVSLCCYHAAAEDLGKRRPWWNHSNADAMQCDLIVLWYSILCESQYWTQVLGISVGLRHRRRHHWHWTFKGFLMVQMYI